MDRNEDIPPGESPPTSLGSRYSVSFDIFTHFWQPYPYCATYTWLGCYSSISRKLSIPWTGSVFGVVYAGEGATLELFSKRWMMTQNLAYRIEIKSQKNLKFKAEHTRVASCRQYSFILLYEAFFILPYPKSVLEFNGSWHLSSNSLTTLMTTACFLIGTWTLAKWFWFWKEKKYAFVFLWTI